MGVQVYLQTDRFEVMLEGITFKRKHFEHLCRLDFIFPDGKIWDRPPVIGIDVMRHPRDPSTLLLLLCFGVGCVILRFAAGERLPASICKFVSDKRIRFVGFSIPEKRDLFPFKELGLRTRKVDVGYMVAEALKQPKFKNWELSDLAWRVLGIKKIVGVTDASAPERHAQMKSAMCRVFIASIIGMGLLHGDDNKLNASPKRSPLLRNLSSFNSFAEGLFKGRKKNDDKLRDECEEDSLCVEIGENDEQFSNGCRDCGSSNDESNSTSRGVTESTKLPLKGILKCPSTKSTGLKSCKSVRLVEEEPPSAALKRANSKGHNVGFII